MERKYGGWWLLAIGLLVCVGCKPDNAPLSTQVAVAEINSAVMPASAPGQTSGAVYLNLINKSDATLIINHVESSLSDHVEVHRSIYDEGMMKMRPVAHVNVAPGKTLKFTPGGYHLMVFDLAFPVKDGETFTITIYFEGGATVTGTANVRTLAL